ncbi:MAG: sugar phosphate isomerase/epimerase [Pedosphaera sp.]|nr:sugar phosphate isomerase/epimerase [Pedosphaera sp.]
MKNHSTLNRRRFLKQSATATLAAAVIPSAFFAGATGKIGPWKFCAFEKPLQFLSYDDLADLMAELGFDGIEATVRPGGHVLPERVEEDLPKFAEALKKRGLEITILTSGINSAAQAHTEKVLRTAARLGIQRYRMLWWRYDLKKAIRPQIEALRPVLSDLVALNREVGISGLYQNHSGADLVGAPLWDIFDLIKDYPPKDIGLAYDIHHSQVEGGLSWPTQFHLVKSHINAVCVKDFVWDQNKVKDVPLGTGRVDKKHMTWLKESTFRGPISLHVEYGEGIGKEALRAAFRKDFDTLREWIKLP